MHYYQFNIGDYRRDTQHLTPLEHGIYRLLIDQYYLTEKPINANALRLLCIRSASEIETANQILNEFFHKLDDGTYIHRRCDQDIERFREKSEKAKASAKKRWNAKAMRTHSEGNANHKPLTTNQEPNKTKGKRFSPPSLSEVQQYCYERKNTVDPQAWVDFYTSNGWKVGKNSMKDWRAAVRTWEKRNEVKREKPKSAPDRIREANRRAQQRDAIEGEII